MTCQALTSSAIAIAFCATLTLPAAAAPGTCASGIPNNTGTSEWTPTSDFTIHSTDTITHLKTGLMWRRCQVGKPDCTSLIGIVGDSLSWSAALNAASTANRNQMAGYVDWRVPNKKELESIIDLCGVSNVSITVNPIAFPVGESFGEVWTSTTHPNNPNVAYSVNFAIGTTRGSTTKSSLLRVLLVRGGKDANAADLLQP